MQLLKLSTKQAVNQITILSALLVLCALTMLCMALIAAWLSLSDPERAVSGEDLRELMTAFASVAFSTLVASSYLLVVAILMRKMPPK